MTRHPFDSDELGRNDPDMEQIGARLERYASEAGHEPPVDLAARIRAALDDEPIPSTGWWASMLATVARLHGPARLIVATAVLLVAVLGAVAIGDVIDWARQDTGSSPNPSEIVAPSPTPTSTPTVTPSPTPSPTATASPSPSASDDEDDDEEETPEPSESDDDNSGRGGGDNSGPGGGGDDD